MLFVMRYWLISSSQMQNMRSFPLNLIEGQKHISQMCSSRNYFFIKTMRDLFRYSFLFSLSSLRRESVNLIGVPQKINWKENIHLLVSDLIVWKISWNDIFVSSEWPFLFFITTILSFFRPILSEKDKWK